VSWQNAERVAMPDLTVKQAAELAGIKPETISDAIRRRALPASYQVNSRHKVSRKDLEQWLKERREKVRTAS
jgi:excisionase family DNA binding protein